MKCYLGTVEFYWVDAQGRLRVAVCVYESLSVCVCVCGLRLQWSSTSYTCIAISKIVMKHLEMTIKFHGFRCSVPGYLFPIISAYMRAVQCDSSCV